MTYDFRKSSIICEIVTRLFLKYNVDIKANR